MLGFASLASAPLGDLGVKNVALTGSSVNTGSPTVADAVLIQDGVFAGLSVITQSPSIDTTAISQNHAISATYNGSGASVPNGTMFEDETFSAPNVLTGTVRVASGVLTQVHDLQTSDITAQNPTSANTSITQVHSLASPDVETQSVSIDSTNLEEGQQLAAPDITLGSVQIDTSAISQIHNLTTPDLTLTPSVATSAISQVHDLTTEDVTSNSPTLSNATSFSTVTFTVTIVGGNPSDHPYYNFGSTNKYAINGSTATADVALSLVEGRTYRFDQSDNSNSNHPLRFSTTANGTHASGTEYTTGVTVVGTAGQAGAYTEITVALGAPQLYYYCSNHSNMGWSAATENSNIAITQDHEFTAEDVSSGAVSLPTLGIVQGFTFSSADITLGIPTVGTTDLTENYVFTSSDITFGNPVVQDSTITAVNAFHTLTGLSSTSSVNLEDPTATATSSVSGLSSNLNISTLDFDAKANITTSSVNSTFTIVDIGTFVEADSSVNLTDVSGTFTLNLPTPANDLFDYDSLADLFSGDRTVHILNNSLGISNTVHISPENYILYIDSYKSNSPVVHISPENHTVYVDAYKDLPKKVLITQ